MDTKDKKEELKEEHVATEEREVTTPEAEVKDEVEEASSEAENTTSEEENVDSFETKYNEANDKYLRLYSDFENFRRRSAKERLDLISTASSDILSALLPIADDFERAINSNKESEDLAAVKEGFELLHNKLLGILTSKGLKPMDSKETEFNIDLHEAITKIPAPTEELKGKVVDVVEKGYYLNNKVLRYAKVVIGE